MTVTELPHFLDLLHQPPPQPAGDTLTYVGDGPSPYGDAALQREAQAVHAAPHGQRNDALNRASFNLHQLVASGHLDDDTVHSVLTNAALAAGLTPRETDATIASGCRAGTQHPRQVTPLDPHPEPTTVTPPDTPPGETESHEHTEAERQAALEQWRERQLAAEVERQRTRRAAERLIIAEEAAATWREPPFRPTLTDELAIVDDPVTYLVDDILPTGGNVLLTAQYKAGKTTLANNLARALADGDKFLARFPTHRTGRIAVWNYEVDERQYRRWLRDTGFANTDVVTVLNLRGYRMPVINPRVEDWIVRWLETHETSVWFVDPFARAFVGSGTSENDNTEVGAFLDTLDVIKERAGVSELILPTHTGRAEAEAGTERARGATRLDDWADVRWLLTKDEQDVRYFRATGRDVDVAEERLDFDAGTRSLCLAGGDRAWEKRRRMVQLVVRVVADHPGVGVQALRQEIRAAGGRGRNEALDAAITEAELDRQILVERPGGRSPVKHYPARTDVRSEAS